MSQPEQYELLSEREMTVVQLLAAGLSDAQIAEELVLSVGTVKWYNRQIYAKLGVRSRTQAVARAVELNLLPSFAAAGQTVKGQESLAQGNLPAPTTSFVGREQEIAAIEQLLLNSRLVTLTGPGGSGKTRLAIEVASRLLNQFADGVVFVSLASLGEPGLVDRAIAQRLGVAETPGRRISAGLRDALRQRSLLLLLDNFEHLLPAAPLVSELLAGAPGLKVLVTSREPLHLYGEHEFRVMPLALPDPNQPTLQAHNEAMVLFEQRARAVDAEFALSAENVEDVAGICVRLDGLPLAIELATAQLSYFSLPELRQRLTDRLGTLTGGPRDAPLRQQTLRDTIAWSYNLLSWAEQALFAALSVFRGGGTLQAVEQVYGEGHVERYLRSLLDKSLVLRRQRGQDEARFGMLETVREFAAQQLEASGQARALRQRHAAFYTALAEQAEVPLRGGPHLDDWLKRLSDEQNNIRAALTWAFDNNQDELGARLAGALGYFWWRAENHQEGRRWTQVALEQSADLADEVRARLLTAVARLAYAVHDRDAGRRYDREAMAIYRRLGDRYNLGWSYLHLSSQSIGDLDAHEEAVLICEEGLAILKELGDKAGVAQALNILGELARLSGDVQQATAVYEACLDIATEIDDLLRQSMIHQNLGYIKLHLGHYQEAERYCRQSLQLELRRRRATRVEAPALVGLAGAVGGQGDAERAARLLGIAEGRYERTGTLPAPGDRPEQERITALLREKLGEASFEALRAAGRKMPWEEGLRFALGGGD